MEINKILKNLECIVDSNGPAMEEYDEFTQMLNKIGGKIKEDEAGRDAIIKIKSKCQCLKDKESLLGHILAKPYGYAGDFHIIDRIYKYDKTENALKWDNYILSSSAAKALRNRKEYFKEKVIQNLPGGSLLNVASGPGRDLFELFNENPSLKINCTCVEMDHQAIEYAKELNKEYMSRIEFIQKNIFRYQTDKKYDLIWSAGLFDYFDDKAFVLLLKRFKGWLKNDGEIIIGNFNQDCNPNRTYMEFFGEWYLIHRTENQLRSLAKSAGFSDERTYVGREPENVNLFLHLKI